MKRHSTLWYSSSFIRKCETFSHVRTLLVTTTILPCGHIFSREDVARSTTHAFACRTLLVKFISSQITIQTKNQVHAPGLMIFQQCSIFPGRRQPSIFDDEKLNYCVRYVNRWILFSIATGNGIITSFLGITENNYNPKTRLCQGI